MLWVAYCMYSVCIPQAESYDQFGDPDEDLLLVSMYEGPHQPCWGYPGEEVCLACV